jgi:hypothetical protein
MKNYLFYVSISTLALITYCNFPSCTNIRAQSNKIVLDTNSQQIGFNLLRSNDSLFINIKNLCVSENYEIEIFYLLYKNGSLIFRVNHYNLVHKEIFPSPKFYIDSDTSYRYYIPLEQVYHLARLKNNQQFQNGDSIMIKILQYSLNPSDSLIYEYNLSVK